MLPRRLINAFGFALPSKKIEPSNFKYETNGFTASFVSVLVEAHIELGSVLTMQSLQYTIIPHTVQFEVDWYAVPMKQLKYTLPHTFHFEVVWYQPESCY